MEDFAIGVVLANSKFQYGVESRSKATEQMTISLLIYMSYQPMLKEKGKRG